mgnify:CR=1 FL=1|tara:strand:- start:146 stop:1564 length:1419 start_codon:yes stop_codon:yes gene_type:complete
MIRIIILVLCDIIAIPLLFLISYAVKFKAGLLYNIIFKTNSGLIYNHAQIEPYFDKIGIIIIIWLMSLIIMRTYNVYSGILGLVDQIVSVVKAVSLATIILMAISMIVELIPNSIFVLMYNVVFGIILFTAIRMMVDNILKIKPFNPKKCCIIGKSKEAQYLLEYIKTQNQRIYNYSGSIYDGDCEEILFSISNSHNKVAIIDDSEEYILKNNIKDVFLIKSEYPKKKIQSLINLCKNKNIILHIFDDEITSALQNRTYTKMAGLNMVTYELEESGFNDEFLKRLLDLIIATCVLIISLPILIVTSVWIKMVSPRGPIIFKQERVGLNGRVFIMYKFRTMIHNAETISGPVWVKENDSRYIKGGQFLRKYSLDELPQLINIFKNDMSVVGPRPERPFFVDQISNDLPEFYLRHKVKGGITGWAQIHGRSFLTTRPKEKLRYDLFYIKNKDLLLDLKIILKTSLIVIKGEQAY